MGVELLSGVLEPEATKALDVRDPRFGEITALALEHQFPEAAAKIEELFAERVFDLRLVSYYLFDHFMREGLIGLGEAFDVYASILTKNWEAFGPAKNKEQQAARSLAWFFKTLNKQLTRHEQLEDEVYRSWLTTPAEKVEALSERAQAFFSALTERVSDDEIKASYSRAARWLADFVSLARSRSELVAVEALEQARTMAKPERDAAEPRAKPAAKTRAKAAPPAPEPEEPGALKVEGSPLMARLIQKLAAFELLVEQGQYDKAALIAADVEDELGSFQAPLYFPSVFSTYTRLMSRHIEQIARHWEHKDTLTWQAMRKHYEVDMEGFIAPD